MAQGDDNPAKPLLDLYKKWTGKEDKKPAPEAKPDTSWHDAQVKKANESFAKPAPADKAPAAKVPSYKKGGMVRRTGLARVHKGERVIPKSKVAKVSKMMKKRG